MEDRSDRGVRGVGGRKTSAFRRVREAPDLSVKEICWVLAEPEL